MLSESFYVVLSVAVAASYLWLAWDAWRALGLDAPAPVSVTGRPVMPLPASGPAVTPPVPGAGLRPSPSRAAARSRAALMLLPLAVLGHAILLAHAVLPDGVFHFGFAHALSATLWITAFVVWIEGFYVPIRGLDLVVLPLAAAVSVLPTVFRGSPLETATDTLALRLHLLTAISAYSLLTVAALHAALMAAMHRHLHGGEARAGGLASRFFAQVPPLLALERLLFRLIGAGFLLLTATIVSGVLFSEALFGRPLRFDHKTVFSIAAWFVFGGLLGGRRAFGWRGKRALQWTVTGFALMLLAYIGTRFVLEVILRRM